uniref:Putative secreted protein n=1 Tax=Ixodes ricinus TaxID=34613 RepID=A0A6B0UNA8_IXORI
MEPPPAATVLMSSWGAWMVTPAVVVSKVWSKCPSNLLTSVEVPPMSKPMTGTRSRGLYEVLAYPTTPPAGPDRMDREPENMCMGVRPPSDCMKSTATSFRFSWNPLVNPSTYFLMHGVR